MFRSCACPSELVSARHPSVLLQGDGNQLQHHQAQRRGQTSPFSEHPRPGGGAAPSRRCRRLPPGCEPRPGCGGCRTRCRWSETGAREPLLCLHLMLFLFGSGVQILDRTSVQQVLVEKSQVTAVETDRGSIQCQYFVNCAGQVKLRPRQLLS